MDPPAPALIRDTTPRRRSRILPGLNSITQTVRDTIVTITEPLSPSLRSEFNLADSSSSSPGLEKHRHWNIVHHRASADATSLSRTTTISPPRTLTTLPPEIQIVILSFLEFGDILRLRRTSKHWYHFATPRLVRSIYGPETFRAMLIEHCSLCLTYCPRDVTRLVTTRLDPGYPLSSRCVRCTVQSGDGAVSVGRKTTLGNFVDYWTCRWCGWPVTADASTGHPQFHRACYDKYAVVLLAFFLLGWVQFFIGVVAAALAWRYFRRDVVVLAPTIVGFVLMWVCIFLIMFRGNRVRTYHWALFIELAIVGLWVSISPARDLLPKAEI